MKELDTVVLTRDMPEHRLHRGDVGAVVHLHGPDAAEVEFVAADGFTVAVVTLTGDDMRPMGGREILHVRPLGSQG